MGNVWKAIPERTGWILSMTMQKQSTGVSSLTNSSTVESLEKSAGNSFLVASRIADITKPIKNEVATATTSENLAVLG